MSDTDLSLRAAATAAVIQRSGSLDDVDRLVMAMARWMDVTGLDLAEATYRLFHGEPQTPEQVTAWRAHILVAVP